MEEKKTKPRLLWLSDIHLFEKRNSKIKYRKLVDNYLSILIKAIQKEEYTHVIITGDISFSSDPEQYANFNSTFLDKILSENIRVITLCGNHDINQSIINDEKKIYEELISKDYSGRNLAVQNIYNQKFIQKNGELLKLNENYRNFFKKYIHEKLDFFVKHNLLEEYYYFTNEGLFGVLYDKEYNIIFNILNTTWFSFGIDRIINLNKDQLLDKIIAKDDDYKQIIKELFGQSEFGHLVYGTLDSQNDILIDLQEKRKRLEECVVISMAHHPFNWMHYETQYDNTYASFDDFIKYSDIFLSGHQHVIQPYSTFFRSSLHCLEAPELLDFKMYLYPKSLINLQNKNLGFSIITLDHEKSSFQNIQYTPPAGFYNLNSTDLQNAKFDKNILKEWKIEKFSHPNRQSNGLPEKIVNRKSILGAFDSFQEMEDFFISNFEVEKKQLFIFEDQQLLVFLKKLYNKSMQIGTNYELNSNNLIGICFKDKFFISFKRIMNSVDFISYINKFKESIIQTLAESDNFIEIIKQFELRFLIFDFFIFYLNSENEQNMDTYQQNYIKLEKIFTLFRYKIFSDFKENMKLKSDKISLTFEIINYEKYKNHFFIEKSYK